MSVLDDLRTRFTVSALIGVVLAVAVPHPGWATEDLPWEAKGYQQSGYDLSRYEQVNLSNGNLTFRIPLTSAFTDGGLRYDVSLFYNSKLFAHRRVRYGVMPEQVTGIAIADGVEAFGTGWELRPPRLQMDARRGQDIRKPLAWIDPSGAKHYLYDTPPWDAHSAAGQPPWTEFQCAFTPFARRCYTWDGSNIRATSLWERDSQESWIFAGVVVEDGTGTRYVHDHTVAASHNNSYSESACDFDDFREDVAGLYLSSVESGPWDAAGSPANRISFTYCSQSGGGCGAGANEPWLPYQITANWLAPGEVQRRVTFRYQVLPTSYGTYHVLDRIEVPSFDPTLGLNTAGTPSVIDLAYAPREYVRDVNVPPSTVDQQDLWSPELREVRFPDGAAFVLGSPPAPFRNDWSITLPSGATVEYSFDRFPIPEENIAKVTGTIPLETLSDPPVIRYCTADGAPGSWTTSGLWRRVTRYRDAATAGEPRVEATEFKQQFNCSNTWPYDFSETLMQVNDQLEPYLYTMVASAPGEFVAGIPGVVATDVHIHRFHRQTYEEFSADRLENVAAEDFLCYINGPLCDMEGAETFRGNYRVLRHEEAEWERLWTDLPYVPDRTGDQGHYVVRRWTWSASDPSGDVGVCYPAYSGAPPTIACATTFEERVLDPYMNVIRREVSGLNQPANTESPLRRLEASFEQHLGPNDPWATSLQTYAKTCDLPAACSAKGQEWTLSGGAFRPTRTFTNPSGTAPPFGYTTNDCVRHDLGYDAVGNLQSDRVTGGYGAAGWDTNGVTTWTTYRHGRPTKKETVDAQAHRLLLWTREIDPNTGLPRWHVDGSGGGFGYLFNAAGRVTDIVPLERNSSGQLALQVAFDNQTLRGTYVEYSFPSSGGPALQRTTVGDRRYTLGARLTAVPDTGVTRSFQEFDGLGRSTHTWERYPGKLATQRSRSDVAYLDPALGRLKLASEWLDGDTYPTPGTGFWTTATFDGLGRSTSAVRPDGTQMSTAYWGDQVTLTTKSVTTEVSGETGTFTSTRTNDLHGRLRVLKEQRSSRAFLTTLYSYDQEDRLVGVTQGSQTRAFTFSGAGFLAATVEPERTTTVTAYGPLGNLTIEATGDVSTSLGYDGYGRLRQRTVAGKVASTFTYGDDQPTEGAIPGEAAYGKLVVTAQHNRLGTSDVLVGHTWSFGGPGRRVNGRTTVLSGLGVASGVGSVAYAYDTFGNLQSVTLPTWSDVTRPADWTKVAYTYSSGWLTRVDRRHGGTSEIVGQMSYLPSGRTARLTYGGGLAYLDEAPDPDGMARPFAYQLVRGGTTLWTEGPYEYDGSGNIDRIGDRRYTYDGVDRLTAAYQGPAPYQTIGQYAYDSVGNISSFNENGRYQVFTHSAGTNRIATVLDSVTGTSAPFGWDVRGNLTTLPAFGDQRAKTLTFSGEDRLLRSVDVASGKTWRYAYDAAGERVAAWMGLGSSITGAKVFLRDEGGQVLSDILYTDSSPTEGEGALTCLLAKDYYLGAGRVLAERDVVAGLPPTYVAADHLGSTRVLFAASGTPQTFEYHPYGQFRQAPIAPASSHLFTGHERDLGSQHSELDYMHARYYTPKLGQFVSVDPVGGTVNKGQSWNRYAYVEDNPIRKLDPDGRDDRSFGERLKQDWVQPLVRLVLEDSPVAARWTERDRPDQANDAYARAAGVTRSVHQRSTLHEVDSNLNEATAYGVFETAKELVATGASKVVGAASGAGTAAYNAVAGARSATVEWATEHVVEVVLDALEDVKPKTDQPAGDPCKVESGLVETVQSSQQRKVN